MQDSFGRTIDYMRISVTDRCNLRCVYCMPKSGVETIPHAEILSFEEIHSVAQNSADLGINKIRITGGEPLVRKGIASLVSMLKQTPGIKTVTMTTNGILFSQFAGELLEAGLDGVNFSLDTLDKQTFVKLTQFDAFDSVMAGIESALALGIKTKLNCVPMAQTREEWVNIAALAKDNPLDVRFIEMMPIGLGRDFETVSNDFVLRKLENAFGKPKPTDMTHGSGPAVYYDFEGFQGSVGFISAISHSFCGSCNRVRLTANGELKPCLCFGEGLALKPLLRSGISDEDLKNTIATVIREKPEKHQFCEAEINGLEKRKMVQIGG